MAPDAPDSSPLGRSVTLRDIATLAGVSVATVSRVFSHPSRLRADTVARVRSIAVDLGYLGNDAARALVTGRFRNIAMIVPDIGNPFYPPLVRAVQNSADQLGYAVFLGDADERGDREHTLISRLAGQVDGFILAGTRLDEKQLRDLSRSRPMVLVNRDVETISRVLIDAGESIRDAVRHLGRLGHGRVVYVAGPADSWANQQRLAAATGAARELSIEMSVVDPGAGNHTFEGGRAAADPVLDTEATAAVTFDDVIAHGLLTGLRARGIETPRDFSVIGCDDTLAIGTDPALTTISHSPADAGAAAVKLLMAVTADAGTEEPACVLIPTQLIRRQTTAAPPRRG